jgi:uncharacterized protein YbaP (TraB family)
MAVNKFMKRVFGSTLLTALWATGTYADALPLWEIQGASNRVFLLGSVHFLRPSDYPLPAGMEAAYAAADELVMEIDMDDLDPVAAQTTMSSLATDGPDLQEGMGKAGYADVAELAKAAGINIEQFASFEPWFAGLMIVQLRMLQMGFDPAWGIETQFSERARKDGKSIRGLETLTGQLSFMDELDMETQRLFLLETLKDSAETEAEMQTIMTAWQTGDTSALAELQLELQQEAPELNDALFTRRNRNWVPQIIELTKQKQDYLVIVGAMHMAGDNSVLELLEAEGIKVRQLSDSSPD